MKKTKAKRPVVARKVEPVVGQTFTLWLWPYFCLREEARPIVSGLTKAQADEIMEREKDRVPGVTFLEHDEMPNAKSEVS